MLGLKKLLGLDKTKLEKLVLKSQKLGRQIDALREQRKQLQADIRKELGE